MPQLLLQLNTNGFSDCKCASGCASEQRSFFAPMDTCAFELYISVHVLIYMHGWAGLEVHKFS